MSEIMDAEDRVSEEEDTLDAILWAIHSGRLPRAEPGTAPENVARDLLERYGRLVTARVRGDMLVELVGQRRDWVARYPKLAQWMPGDPVIPMVVDAPVQGEAAPGPPAVADAHEHERRQLPSVDG